MQLSGDVRSLRALQSPPTDAGRLELMINTPTVLILGAGASAHLGYPIGTELVNKVCERVAKRTYQKSIRERHTEEEITDFFMRLSRSGYYSVDTFLEDNRGLLDIGKLFIADALKVHERPDAPFPPGNSGWYQHLLNCLLGPSPDSIPENRLSIITFNYDRSLEFYLHQAISYRYRLPQDAALHLLSRLNIMHPHGILGEYPAVSYSPSADGHALYAISRAITIVHELTDSADGFCTPDFRACHDALTRAQRVYFLGFGFHEDNVRRMAFFNEGTIGKRDVLATTFELMPKDREYILAKVGKYGFTKDNFPSVNMNCARFFRFYGVLD